MNRPTDGPSKRPRTPFDRRAALALIWALAFGVIYARMVIVERILAAATRSRR